VDDWKLIYHHVTRRVELFNLKEDLGEQADLSRREPAKARELAEILADFLRETEAGMTIDAATNRPIEYPDEILASG
jgi:hypothetical protein